MSAMLAPYSPKGKAPSAEDFNPIEKPPQHQDQMLEQLRLLAKSLGQ